MFKVYMDVNEAQVHTNLLTFNTVQAAIAYARDLYSRWTLTVGWFVLGELNDDGEPRDAHIDRHQAWLDCESALLRNGATYTRPDPQSEEHRCPECGEAGGIVETTYERHPGRIDFECLDCGYHSRGGHETP